MGNKLNALNVEVFCIIFLRFSNLARKSKLIQFSKLEVGIHIFRVRTIIEIYVTIGVKWYAEEFFFRSRSCSLDVAKQTNPFHLQHGFKTVPLLIY